MRFVRHSISVAISAAALAATVASPAGAQEAPVQASEGAVFENGDGAAVALPELSVEAEAAPAKRNKKKQALKKNAAATAASSATPGVVNADALPGIVVEGEKVVRTMRDTTTSIGVVTGQQIRDEQIEDLQGALNSQANVLATEGSGGNNGFVIRGLNSEGFTQGNAPAAAPLISVVIDGATQNSEATRRGARGLWDVEQVEVLRGPQTTLQSRNALGGSVYIKTNDPSYKWLTIVEGTAGGNDLRSGGFVFNAPIVAGQSALRIAGQSFQRNHNITYGDAEHESYDDDVLRTLRGKLLLEPDAIPGLSALFTISRVDDSPAVMSVSAPFFDRYYDTTGSVDFRATKTTNYIADISYDLGAGLNLHSITAYADTETEIGSPASASYQRDVMRDGGDFTQDLRVEIENRGNGLSGVVGLFYGSFKYANDTVDVLDPSSLNPMIPPGFASITVQDLITETKTESMAAYADLRYRFLDRFVVIGGGRILRDKVQSATDGLLFQDPLGILQAYPGYPFPTSGYAVPRSFSEEFTEVLPKIGLTYDLTSDQTVGLMYNKGYRNGFVELNLNAGAFDVVKPEYLDAYEVSYRSNWANGTFSFNANAFYYDYKNQQVAFEEDLFGMLPYPSTHILNADSSHAYGAEFEARWRPIAPLQLYGSLGLMRTKFDSFVKPQTFFGGPEQDFAGNKFPEAPAYTIAAGGMYRDPSGWFAGANVRHTDGYYSGADLANTAMRFVDGYTLVDARVGYEWDNYTLTLFAKNLFDENYVTSKSSATLATVGDEQLIGVTLRGQF